MRIVFSDNQLHLRLAPLTLTRPVAELRFGILTTTQSWLKHLKSNQSAYETEQYLQEKFPSLKNYDLLIAGNIKPDAELVRWVKALKKGESLVVNKLWIANRGARALRQIHKTKKDLLYIEHPWDLFQKNEQAIAVDYHLLTKGRKSAKPDKTNRISGKNIFIEKGAKLKFATINAETGPVYIGKDAEIMEGAIIRGPFALGEHATVKMGAKIYGPTTIGPECKVGGEISNCIFQAYSNKGHDGFIGNSYIGEWCNFGADTNSSNLMNTYGKLKIYSYETKKSEQTDITFCGLIMGDHCKTGINTMLNTGTVCGVSANIFGPGFPAKFIPSFTWGATEKSEQFRLDKAFEIAQNMMARRNINLSAADKKILEHVHKMAQ